MPGADALRLEGLVQACLDQAQTRRADQAARFLRANAARMEQRLRALSAWADGGGPAAGALSALELSDAMDRLNAAARRCERGPEGGEP